MSVSSRGFSGNATTVEKISEWYERWSALPARFENIGYQVRPMEGQAARALFDLADDGILAFQELTTILNGGIR